MCISLCYCQMLLLGNTGWPEMSCSGRVKIELAGVCLIWTLLLCITSVPGSGVVTAHLASLWSCLEKTAVFKVFFDDDVCHGVEHDLDVLCVCGTGQVGVDFFLALLHVQVQKLCLDVVAGIVVCVGA